MTYFELEAYILDKMPNAEITEDESGEIIVRTGLHETLDSTLVPVEFI